MSVVMLVILFVLCAFIVILFALYIVSDREINRIVRRVKDEEKGSEKQKIKKGDAADALRVFQEGKKRSSRE